MFLSSRIPFSLSVWAPLTREIYSMRIKDEFGSDTDEIGFECHFLSHFNPDTNANADLIGYEYKTNSSNPDIFSI